MCIYMYQNKLYYILFTCQNKTCILYIYCTYVVYTCIRIRYVYFTYMYIQDMYVYTRYVYTYVYTCIRINFITSYIHVIRYIVHSHKICILYIVIRYEYFTYPVYTYMPIRYVYFTYPVYTYMYIQDI